MESEADATRLVCVHTHLQVASHLPRQQQLRGVHEGLRNTDLYR